MRGFVVVVLPLLLLLLTNARAEVHCATMRVLHGNPVYIQEKTEQDGWGNVRAFTQVYMPWHITPAAPLSDSRLLTDLATDLPWVQEIVTDNQQLLSFQLAKLEWGAVSVEAPKCPVKTGDTVRLGWAETSYAKVFCELPIPCNVKQTQEYGIDYSSQNEWGSSPRVVRNGESFAPQGGKESMDTIVESANAPQSRLTVIPLSVYHYSGAHYPLNALSYRTCVDINLPRILELVEARLHSEPAAAAAVAEAAVSPGGADFISLPEGHTEASSASIWPIRDCLSEEESGICTAGGVYKARERIHRGILIRDY